MMDEFQLYEHLTEHFEDGMEALQASWISGTPNYVLSGTGQNLWVEWPNEQNGVDISKDSNGHARPWVRYNYRPVTGGQATLSENPVFFTGGLIIHQIFAPPYQGLQTALSIATSVRSVYDGKVSVGGVWFRNTRPQVVGLKGGWFQVNVSVNFEYDFRR